MTGQHPSPSPSPKQVGTEATTADSHSNIAATNYELAGRAKRKSNPEPCGTRRYQSNDELCAQWKAADAAVDAVGWASWATIWSGVSLIAVAIAIGLTIHSNWIARDTAQRQLRAYVLCDDIEIGGDFENGNLKMLAFEITMHWKNGGATPATDLVLKIGWVPDKGESPSEYRFQSVAGYDTMRHSIGPGGIATTRVRIPVPKMRLEEGFSTFIYAFVEYHDSFRQRLRRSERCVKLIIPSIPPKKGDSFHTISVGPFNGVDEGCYMPVQTEPQRTA